MRIKKGFSNGETITPYLPSRLGNEKIKELLSQSGPVLIARYGYYELRIVAGHYLNEDKTVKLGLPSLVNNAGFFPALLEMIPEFTQIFLDSTLLIDCYTACNFRKGLWRYEENIYRNYCPNAFLTDIQALNFYRFAHPWTSALHGKKILVVHPFADTIFQQYHHNQKNLFNSDEVLPSFESLESIKAVQSSAGNPTPFENWFEALDHMKKQIEQKDFEIALIGAGAYGLPLAAHVKSMGRKAVHMGGVTQTLFGIKGKRWDYMPGLYNEFWVRPPAIDRPLNFKNVEDGCYW